MSQLIIENISVELNRKNIKNLSIRIVPPNGEVKVSAPYFMTMSKIENFICARKNWILNAQQKTINKYKTTENLQYKTDKSYVSGDEIYIWGQSFVLEVLPSTRWKMELNDNNRRAHLFATKNSDAEKRKNYLKKWYSDQLLEKAQAVLEKWERVTGLKAQNLVARWTKTVWGTCDKQKKRIMLNAQLATKDPKYLDYVVLHELAHLKYANHGVQFKNFMTKYMPEWKKLRRELNG